MMPRVVCLWFPNWPIQRVQRERPELENRSLVLFAERRKRLAVIACSSALQQHGIQPGMPLAEARALLGTSGRTVLLEHDPAADRRYLQRLAQRLQQFSPMTALMPVEPCDSALIDISGCAHLFGGEVSLAHQLWGEIVGERLQAAVCISDTPGAAWAVAKYGSRRLVIVPEGEQAAFLNPLSLRALRLSPGCLDKLAAVALNTIGELRELPRESLPSRFGKELLTRLDQALGDAGELITFERLAEPIEAAWAGEESLQDLNYLETIWRDLLDQILARLRPQRLGIRELDVMHRSEEGVEVVLELRLHRPAYESRYLVDLLSLQRERRPIAAGVLVVRARVTVPGREQTRQVTLFDDESDRVSRSLAGLLDRLRSRLGDRAVTCPGLVADPQPEYSRSFLSPDASPLEVGRPCDAPDLPERAVSRCRPLRLFREPKLVQLLGDRRFVWNGRRVAVTQIDQPERIETGWQRDREVRRDYYRMRLESGEFLWVYRCDATGCWYVHGTFD
jgi:protein ImuB